MSAYRFLAKTYNELMSDVDYSTWAAYIHNLIGKNGVRIYETACGTGSLTCRLYDLGYDIVASDISAEMLREAVKAARGGGRDITFVQQDMRSFETGRKADAVVSACDGVNYIDAQGLRQFADCAYGALKDGGLLLFDISTKAKLSAMDKQVYFDDADDVTCIWRNAFDEKNDKLRMDVTIFVRRGELFERQSETHIQYAHDIETVRKIMLSAGFTQVQVYDFPTKNTCTDTAQRAQFVCVKEQRIQFPAGMV